MLHSFSNCPAELVEAFTHQFNAITNIYRAWGEVELIVINSCSCFCLYFIFILEPKQMSIILINKKVINKVKRPAMQWLCCAVFFCMPCTLLHAQKIEEGFDVSFKPTKGFARYYVITEQKEGRWYREAYYLPEKSIAMNGWYKDKNCEIPEGEVNWYFTNRSLKSQVNYVNGKKDGLSLQYHENGMMSDSVNYSGGHRKGIGLRWDAEGYRTDSSDFDGAGNGVEVRWYSGGTVRYAGRLTNDTAKIKRWNYYHPNGKLNAIEYYVDGKRTSCSCFDADGKQLDSLLCIKEEEAQFPKGIAGWRSFIEKNLNSNVAVDHGAPAGSYTVMVRFVVDTDGSVTDIKALTNFGFGMEAEVVKLIKKSPAWTPAMQFGRKVKSYHTQPVTFVVSR